jgi:phosphatidylserine/phosphatidylglycerophosphate/cardiolipin synthase-like enzyme
MKTTMTRIATIAIVTATLFSTAYAGDNIRVYFSPNGHAGDAFTQRMNAATTSIDIVTYSISQIDITTAILAAHQRGVQVRLVVDKGQEALNYSTAPMLAAAGVPTLTDNHHALQHNKYAIIDGHTVATGSYNYTDNAERRNAENLIIIDDEETATAYAADFDTHWNHARPYRPRTLPK